MKFKSCAECGQELRWMQRADAIYCSSACRLKSHRNPFPTELTKLKQWVRYSKTKVPLTVENQVANSTDSKTWASFESVKKSNAGVGIGFVFNGNGMIGIDFDNAISEGQLKDWARKIIDSLPLTYTEISISGQGVHIIGRAELLRGRRFMVADGAVEIYGVGRFFTMTGKRLGKSPKKINHLGESLNRLIEELDASRSTTKTSRA